MSEEVKDETVTLNLKNVYIKGDEDDPMSKSEEVC